MAQDPLGFVAGGKGKSAGGLLGVCTGITSIARAGLGTYLVTLSQGITDDDCIVNAWPLASAVGGVTAAYSRPTPTTIGIVFVDSTSTATDGDFAIGVWRTNPV